MEEKAIFNDDVVVLDTAVAEHHAALLLAHLRAAKNGQKLNSTEDGEDN